jgi:hypothetical protein
MSKITTTTRTRTQQSDPTPANIPAAHPQHIQSWEDPWNTTIPSHYQKMEEKMSGSKRRSASRSVSECDSVESGYSGTKMARMSISDKIDDNNHCDSQSKIIPLASNVLHDRTGAWRDVPGMLSYEKKHPKIIMEDSNATITNEPTDALDSFDPETDEACQRQRLNRIVEYPSNESKISACPSNVARKIDIELDTPQSTKKEPKEPKKQCKPYKPPKGKRRY